MNFFIFQIGLKIKTKNLENGNEYFSLNNNKRYVSSANNQFDHMSIFEILKIKPLETSR